jgi:hypothetical protein
MNKRSILAAGTSLHPRRTLASAAAATLGCLALATSSSAAKPPPNPEFVPFSDCPAYVKHVAHCIVAQTTSGEFVLGNKTVPINKTITVQGGLIEGSTVLVPANDGNTLSKTPLTVPGGLTGIEGLSLGEVTATTELTGPVEIFANNLEGAGPAVKLPIKVRLENPVLGESCYVGSEAAPIVLNLTTGTTNPPPPNKPISGNPGTVSLNPALTIITISGNSLVDNSFAAPGAEGCGGLLSPVLDLVVNLQASLPAASGKNTAILNGSLQETDVKDVKKAKVVPRG